MSLWVFILMFILYGALALAGLFLLFAALFHVRGDAAWFGMWTGGAELPHETSVRLEFGFPGFMRGFALGGTPTQAREASPSASSAAESPTASATSGQSGSSAASSAPAQSSSPLSSPAEPAPNPPQTADLVRGMKASGAGATYDINQSVTTDTHTAASQGENAEARGERGVDQKPKRDPNRYRKALFRFVTDGTVWALIFGYGLRLVARAVRLPGLRLELSAGHPDPAFLGRMAGRWYAFAPVLPPGRVHMNFRFQDRHPSFGARVTGGFSLLAFLWFCAMALLTFPLFRLGRRAWFGWTHRTLGGWRARAYRWIQAR